MTAGWHCVPHVVSQTSGNTGLTSHSNSLTQAPDTSPLFAATIALVKHAPAIVELM